MQNASLVFPISKTVEIVTRGERSLSDYQLGMSESPQDSEGNKKSRIQANEFETRLIGLKISRRKTSSWAAGALDMVALNPEISMLKGLVEKEHLGKVRGI
jgi:hypothetical protein